MSINTRVINNYLLTIGRVGGLFYLIIYNMFAVCLEQQGL